MWQSVGAWRKGEGGLIWWEEVALLRIANAGWRAAEQIDEYESDEVRSSVTDKDGELLV